MNEEEEKVQLFFSISSSYKHNPIELLVDFVYLSEIGALIIYRPLFFIENGLKKIRHDPNVVH